jgi:protease-4
MASSRFMRVLGRSWAWLDGLRRAVLNLLFVGIVVALMVALLGGGPPALRERTALVFDVRGPLVEQRAGDMRGSLLKEVSGEDTRQTRLRDVLLALDSAAKDPKITSLVLALDDFGGAGLATLREVAAAITRFKASGKPVIAWGSGYDQRGYYLAAHADQVLLHPMGGVTIEGYGRYRNYYRDALDRLGLSANVLRVGTYKNFGEPYFANAPSKETLEAEGQLYGGLWRTYTDGVEAARKLPAGSIAQAIEDLPRRFAAAGGDPARLALQEKLVDALKTRDEMRAMMIERGAQDEVSKSFRQVSLADYAARQKPPAGGDAVGVVVAEGEIVSGAAPPGTVGGRSTAELIRKARDDERIKAVVLRVNSPGGSAFGSELVRRELELTRAAGKPVVVSMGDVAASGGYWISMAADQVIADPATVTGSIGVFAMLPTADRALDKLSVHVGGVATTWLVGAYDPRRPLDPRFAEVVQSAIGHIYTDFTTKAAQARKTTQAKVDAVGQGRVWTGAQAHERGLVDATGSFADAIKEAASRAKLGDEPRLRYLENEPGRFAWLFDLLGGRAMLQWVAHQLQGPALPGAEIARQAQRELGWLAEMGRSPGQEGLPFTAVTHCLCEAP